MNSKQRVLTALDKRQPDKVPIIESIDESIQIKIARIIGLEMPEENMPFRDVELNCRLVEMIGLDGVDSFPSTGIKPISENHLRDKFGCTFLRSDHGVPVVLNGPIKEAKDLKSFDMASFIATEDLDNTRYTAEKLGGEKACVVWCEDPFKLSWILRGGMQHLLMDYTQNPEMVHDLARTTTDYNLALIELASKAGADVIVLEGDLAGEQTTLVSPSHYREFIKPYQLEIVDCAHEYGLKIIKHSDGNIWPILDDFIEVEFDGYHPIQPDCMDISEVKAHVGGKLCLIGNIDCRELLCNSSEENVENVVKHTIKTAAPGGGYILSSSNSIHPGVKPENYIAMVKTAEKYRDYPV
jgi:uroporphyrinogen decarboxylase